MSNNQSIIPPELLLNALGGQLVLKKDEIRANLQGKIGVLETRLKELKGRKAQIQSQSSSAGDSVKNVLTSSESEGDIGGGWEEENTWATLDQPTGWGGPSAPDGKPAETEAEGDIGGGWEEENTWASLDQPTGWGAPSVPDGKPTETEDKGDIGGGWEEENTWATLDQPTGEKPAETEDGSDIGGWEEENTWATLDQPTGWGAPSVPDGKPAETEDGGDIGGGWEEENTWATLDQPTGEKPAETKKNVSPVPVAPEVSPAPVENDLDDLSLDSLLGLAKSFTGDDK